MIVKIVFICVELTVNYNECVVGQRVYLTFIFNNFVKSEDHPHGKKCKNAKWLSEEVLQTAVKRKEAKEKEKRKDIPI